MNVFSKVFGTRSQREVKRIMPLVEKTESYQSQMQQLTDEQLRDKTREYKKRLAEGETLDDLLPEAFATVREAAKRVLGMEHYRVQIIGGIILHQGRIAEMKTGEGKTLVSTLPAYLNALEGKGVHIVTVNDYLAKRDAEWMGKVHEFLGLTVGVVLNDMKPEERRAAYGCDITYVTNNELGFDYLRDNMVIYKEQLVQRDLHYCIIDEIDSVLIDEARTPLIISGQSGKSTKLYEVCDILAQQLERGEASHEMTKMAAIMGEEVIETGDFVVNEKDKIVNLTEQGIKKVEKFFNIENLADPENLEIQHNIILALRAHNLMHKDQDYVVKDDEILIVDEFTGRIMPGRRYSDGLHQAIEAKEHVKVKRESKTLATITFQNFFNKYDKKGGMTGTALTEEKEFRDIYGMDVVEIPTNRVVQRKDLDDAVYMTKKEKFNAVVEAVKEAHAKHQPVLVGTITIETSELLSRMLKREGIPHNVLNAKFHELEAEIVAQAGQADAVTIATNMAGRGTDIKLDDVAREAGGLKIIGTERHESRRIDNQLRGRSGRQGDPGESRFYISLEDDLMRLFGSERLMKVFTSLGVEENEQIEHKMLSNAIEKAQEKIEFNNFGIRKNLLDYDQVNNEQREIIYEERRQVLDGENMRDAIYKMITDIVDSMTDMCFSDDMDSSEWDLDEFNTAITPIIPIHPLTAEKVKGHKKDEIKHIVKEEAVKLYEAKEAEFPEPEQLRELERVVLLKCIDSKWMDHIDDMEMLRQGIGLMAYGQRDPVVEYKMNAFEMFNNMITSIQEDTVRMLYHVHVEQKIEREQVAKVTGTNKDDSTGPKKPVQRKEDKVYPNDPCPCGSGKKYKQCCGRKAAKI
ncbi:preprotein translocase subunit SecA [Blautia sp. NSJ-166]|uniref:preprotein translocase subunit SecA n=1 Tax=Blautia sp. NSJ-166 TaxID=2931882 RepID=UPI001FD04820|nr:preprotein translocase subunit SecA [Blautia sp. NSJ-166]MCJ8044935.1 preprotein translocase subunit SecA [Blautia sp. NSJ-166]